MVDVLGAYGKETKVQPRLPLHSCPLLTRQDITLGFLEVSYFTVPCLTHVWVAVCSLPAEGGIQILTVFCCRLVARNAQFSFPWGQMCGADHGAGLCLLTEVETRCQKLALDI